MKKVCEQQRVGQRPGLLKQSWHHRQGEIEAKGLKKEVGDGGSYYLMKQGLALNFRGPLFPSPAPVTAGE